LFSIDHSEHSAGKFSHYVRAFKASAVVDEVVKFESCNVYFGVDRLIIVADTDSKEAFFVVYSTISKTSLSKKRHVSLTLNARGGFILSICFVIFFCLWVAKVLEVHYFVMGADASCLLIQFQQDDRQDLDHVIESIFAFGIRESAGDTMKCLRLPSSHELMIYWQSDEGPKPPVHQFVDPIPEEFSPDLQPIEPKARKVGQAVLAQIPKVPEFNQVRMPIHWTFCYKPKL
jgi:hypothetical protein